MKKIKIKNKIIKKFWEIDLASAKLINFFYLFFLIISLVYAGLILGLIQKMEKGPSVTINYNYPSLFESDIRQLVAGHPIEKMAPYISRRDKQVAGYLVAIAKKESNWGKFSPKKDGRECYNYWGYRGSYNQTASGYSCFDSPRQAVAVVGKRIQELVDQDLDTPRKMAVWKCGWDCSGHGEQAVDKWVSDVDYYYQKVYQ